MRAISSVRGRVAGWLLAGTVVVAGGGCTSYGPPPETVPFVDLNRYIGLWYEIASNPTFFNTDLVGVTAEYGLRPDGTISVLNRGFTGSLDGEPTSIEGTARVVDTQTNSKLAVEFSPFGSLFAGDYWIVLLDTVNYEYAVVTDSLQMTLFVLSRDPAMDTALYNSIVAQLDSQLVDTSRLNVTGMLKNGASAVSTTVVKAPATTSSGEDMSRLRTSRTREARFTRPERSRRVR